MGGGRVRTSQLWLRIAVARLKAVPYLTTFLVIMLVATAVTGPMMAARRERDALPVPVPLPVPSGSPAPSPTATPAVTGSPAPNRSTRPPVHPAIPRSPSRPVTSRSPARLPLPRPPVGRPSAERPPAIGPTATRPALTPPSSSAPSPSETVTPTKPATTTPVTVTATVSASPRRATAVCEYGVVIEYVGVIRVDRPASVTSVWGDSSSVPVTGEITPEHERRTVIRETVFGTAGKVRTGGMDLSVTAPDGRTVSALGTYSINCVSSLAPGNGSAG